MDLLVACHILTRHAVSGGGRPCIPRPTPLHTTHTPTSGDASQNEGLPIQSSAPHRMWRIFPGNGPSLILRIQRLRHVYYEPNPLKEAN